MFLEGKDPLWFLDEKYLGKKEEVQEEVDWDQRDNKNEDSNMEREG